MIEIESGGYVAIGEQARGLGGEAAQQTRRLVEPARVRDVAQIAVERRLQVVGEPTLASTSGAKPRFRVAAGGSNGCERLAPDRSSGDEWRMSVEERVDDVARRSRISVCDSGQSRTMSMRPVNASFTFLEVTTFAEPVNRYRPASSGWASTSCLMARRRSGAR